MPVRAFVCCSQQTVISTHGNPAYPESVVLILHPREILVPALWCGDTLRDREYIAYVEITLNAAPRVRNTKSRSYTKPDKIARKKK